MNFKGFETIRKGYVGRKRLKIWKVLVRGRPFENAVNSYLEFTADMSQKFGCWANIWALIEKSENLIICIGYLAPLRTFLLKSF
jgi:hypothetical protein